MSAGRAAAYVGAPLALVCLGWACGGRAPDEHVRVASATATAAPPAERRAAGGYRVLGTPLVLFEDSEPPGVDIVVRFNRRLHRDRIDGEGVGADFRVAGAGSLDTAPEAIGQPAKHCYAGYFGNDARRFTPRDGEGRRLTIEIVGVKRRLLVDTTVHGPVAPDDLNAAIESLCGRVG
jgi:hypothetical protein